MGSQQPGRRISQEEELQAQFSDIRDSIADQALSQEILDLVQQASHYRQLKKVIWQ